MQPFKALLVEGTSGVGKSTLIDALIRRHAASRGPRKLRTLVHLAQSHTFGPLVRPGDHGTLTVEANQRHLDRVTGTIEWLHESVLEHEKPWCFVLMDTLHPTHCVRPGVVGWSDVAACDERLAAAGCRLLCLHAAPAAIWDRGIVPRMNEQFMLEYARRFGSTHEEIHRYFVGEQDRLLDLCTRSAMPKLLLANDGAPEAAADAAWNFWTGDASAN
jgi:hypothetical protein